VKIICKDNYDRDTESDRLIAENIPCERMAKVMADALNAAESASTENFYEAKPDDYKLHTFEP
jgi:hypothetical protein